MSSLYETCTKEKTISYKQRLFIKTSLRQLGFNPKHNGFILLQKAIIYAYKQDMITINLEEIYKYLAHKTNKPYKTIESDIRYSFYNINIKKLSQNYINIFQLEFSLEYLSIKNLINDFLDFINIPY